MNLYHKKQRWKIVLLGIAMIMIGASIWFSYSIVQKVQEREVDRVQQWADAVKRKSQLVSLTNHAFEEMALTISRLKERDRQKIEIWSLAIEEINKPLDDYSLVLAILQSNDAFPVIITDKQDNIISDYNLQALDSAIRIKISAEHKGEPIEEINALCKSAKDDSLQSFLEFWPLEHPPLEIDLYQGEKQKIFYFDSIYFKTQKLKALEKSRDSLINAFSDELVNNEYLVPVMFVDKTSREVIATNMPEYDSTNANAIIQDLAQVNDSILVDLDETHSGVIYFKHSEEIKQMKYFPFVQFFMIGLFVLVAYLAFSAFRKAEQDQVWAGMAKETAHQLGTPISSLMAWNELLIGQGVDQTVTDEIKKDIDRLTTVTDRFSKIGSESALVEQNMVPILQGSVDYLRNRISSKIELNLSASRPELICSVNASLIEWVVENLTKNAVDAMDGTGKISIYAEQIEDRIIIDITDNGKGIAPNKIKTVFQPGYTTKKRGWGLGLSLVKRIVEEFHKGKVYVLKSELGVGTTFRISLPV